MDLRRMLGGFNHLGRTLVERHITPPDDETDGYELAASARDFSSATRKVVDDKLTFSAALLRAGEVDEAQKILAEVEHDVRNEEAALLERVNEVSAKRAVTRAHMTRMRLVRMLATAMVGAGLLGVSAMGMAVAGMFDEGSRKQRHKDRARHARLADTRGDGVKKVVIGGIKLELSKRDLQRFRRLTSGSIDALVLKKFLAADLALPPDVVDHTLAMVLSRGGTLKSDIEKAVSSASASSQDPTSILNSTKKKTGKVKDQASGSGRPNEKSSPPPDDDPPEETPAAETEEEEEDDGSGDDGEGQDNGLPGLDDL